jgi:hypothetical protein
MQAGLFEEITIDMPGWQATFLNLVRQGKRIHYNADTVTHDDAQTKTQAFANLNKVCRIGTYLFHFG